MLRFALVTYLNITVLLGPGLCCCSAHFLFPWAESSGCCSRSPKEVASHSHHAHSHHHHHSPSHHEHSGRSNVAEHSKLPANSDHGQEPCPCGRHQQTFLASQSCDGSAVRAIDAKVHSCWGLAVDISLLGISGPEICFSPAVDLLRSGELSGREILRAHHRLQC